MAMQNERSENERLKNEQHNSNIVFAGQGLFSPTLRFFSPKELVGFSCVCRSWNHQVDEELRSKYGMTRSEFMQMYRNLRKKFSISQGCYILIDYPRLLLDGYMSIENAKKLLALDFATLGEGKKEALLEISTHKVWRLAGKCNITSLNLDVLLDSPKEVRSTLATARSNDIRDLATKCRITVEDMLQLQDEMVLLLVRYKNSARVAALMTKAGFSFAELKSLDQQKRELLVSYCGEVVSLVKDAKIPRGNLTSLNKDVLSECLQRSYEIINGINNHTFSFEQLQKMNSKEELVEFLNQHQSPNTFVPR